MHKFNSVIFREYDIRGRYGDELTDECAYWIGRNFADLFGGGARVCVGRDGRNSSPVLAKRLIAGLLDRGMEVVDLGVVPSPALYFAANHLDADGAIIVTASHNPPMDNGFKFMLGKDSMHGEEIARLAVCNPKLSLESQKGSIKKIDIRIKYTNHILQHLEPSAHNLRIAWDAANGAMGEVLDITTSQLLENAFDEGCPEGGHFLINSDIDGDFPQHPADPTILENNEQLIKTIIDDDCDVGFGFDGDGDRLGVIDEKGRMFAGDQLLAILAREVLENEPNSTIIADIKSSDLLAEEVQKRSGKLTLWKTGHSLIKAKMKELDAPLAGEMSAHIFFRENFGYDDALFAAVKFLNVMQKSGLKASELLDSLPKRFSSEEIRIAVDGTEKFALIERLISKLTEDGADFQKLDGVRVQRGYGWWLLRASNTGAKLVSRYESAIEADFGKIRNDLNKYLEFLGIGRV